MVLREDCKNSRVEMLRPGAFVAVGYNADLMLFVLSGAQASTEDENTTGKVYP